MGIKLRRSQPIPKALFVEELCPSQHWVARLGPLRGPILPPFFSERFALEANENYPKEEISLMQELLLLPRRMSSSTKTKQNHIFALEVAYRNDLGLDGFRGG